MIVKLCQFQSDQDSSEKLVRVFQPGEMEKAASFFGMGEAVPLLPSVQAYLDRVRPNPTKIVVLINALGAGEYWASNINGDFFPESALIHKGPVYGYETFYDAWPYLNHVNKDPAKSFGKVVLSCWHDVMKRVELIVEIDREKAARVGATSVCDKLDQGIFSDVSMGCKVPYDLCSICTEWDKYRKAQQTYDPSKHKSVSAAVLEVHKKNPIRGVSITRNDYCECLRKKLNKILPDGRRVCAINDFPRFFDISFVFIGADKTAKVMAKLASADFVGDTVPSWYLAEQAGYAEEGLEKAASVNIDNLIEEADKRLPGFKTKVSARIKNASHLKAGEIMKEIIPSQFGGKAVPVDHKDPDLPKDVLNALGKSDLGSALSTPTVMGIVLRPHEFQRVVLVRSGKRDLADELDSKNLVFPPVDDIDRSAPMRPSLFSGMLKQLLLPFLGSRSAIEPVTRRRIIRITIQCCPAGEAREPDFLDGDPLLSKLSSAYNGYLDRITDCFKKTAEFVESDPELWAAVHGQSLRDGFSKTAGELTPLGVGIGAAGAMYVLSTLADWENQKAARGEREPTGAVMNFVAKHPLILSFLAGMGAMHAKGSPIPSQIVATLTDLGRHVVTKE